MADRHFEIHKYDLTIANSHDIAIIYGSLKEEKSGFPIIYCNYNMRSRTRLTENYDKLIRSYPGYAGIGIGANEEINEFIQQNKL